MRPKLCLLITVSLLCLTLAVCALAGPACPDPHNVTEPATGIQVTVYDRGDEYFSCMTDTSGCIVEPYGGYLWYVGAKGDGLTLTGRVTQAEKDTANALHPGEIPSLQAALTALRDSLPAQDADKSAVPQIPTGYDASAAPGDAGCGHITAADTDNVEKPAREATCPLLVLHIQYADMPAAFDDAAWHQRVFEDGVSDYYTKISEGTFTYTPAQETSGTADDGVITVTLPISAPRWARDVAGNQNNYNGVMAGMYRGTDGKDYAIYNESSLFMYAMAAAEPYLPDLSQYDRNRDGFISPTEMAFLVVSSGGEASIMGTLDIQGLPGVWAHSGTSHDYRRNVSGGRYLAVRLGSVLVYKYTIIGEAASGTMRPGQSPAWVSPVQLQFGTVCHELGHDLGLMDLYDTSYANLELSVGHLSVMAGGSWGKASYGDESGSSPTHMDAFSKACLGFADTPVIAKDGVYTLSAPESTAGYSAYRINTDNPDIYYLLENRRYLGYDRGLNGGYDDFAANDGGIVVWRIDNHAVTSYWNLNTINGHEDEYGVMPVFHNRLARKPFYGGYDFTGGTQTRQLLLDGTTIQLTFFAESAASMNVSVALSHPLLPPVITTTALPNGHLGVLYSEPLTATSDLPVTWRLTGGSLPDGLFIVNSTLTGMAAAKGTFTFTLSADNGIAPAATRTYTVTILDKQPPAITTASLEDGYVGDPYEVELSATGTPPFTWRILRGQLPQGLALSTDGSISGTPEAPGTATFTVGVSGGASPEAQKTLSIHISVIEGEPTITMDALPAGAVGVPYSQTINVSGTLPIRVTLTSGALPQGLSLQNGRIQGTPTRAGETVFTITASNGIGEDAVQTMALYIMDAPTPPVILTTQLPDGLLGVSYEQFLEVSGGGHLTWRIVNGHLPDGLMLLGDTITGTPLETGTFSFTLAVSNGVSPDGQCAYTLTIGRAQSAPVILDDSLPVGQVDEHYSHTLRATGGGDMVWQVTGRLPTGLSFIDDTIVGTPSREGTYPLTFTAQNGIGPDAVKTLTLTICRFTCELHTYVTPTDAGTVTGGGTYYDGASVTLTATANPGYRFLRWMDTDVEDGTLYDEYSDKNPLRFTLPYEMALTAEFGRTVTITAQPADCTVLVGGQASFTVEAAGDRLTCQWSVDRGDGRGWQTLQGATSAIYRTAAVTLQNDGYRYRCIITDAEGHTATTDTAVLHVEAAPPATGDDGMPLVWLLCLTLGAAGCLALMGRRRRAG